MNHSSHKLHSRTLTSLYFSLRLESSLNSLVYQSSVVVHVIQKTLPQSSSARMHAYTPFPASPTAETPARRAQGPSKRECAVRYCPSRSVPA
jgi:hypothetical protein